MFRILALFCILAALLIAPVLAVDGDEPAVPSDSFLKDVLVELFGPYEQQSETVTELLPDGSSVTYERLITGVAGLDYEWLASVGLFALVVFCFFRIVGGVLKQ